MNSNFSEEKTPQLRCTRDAHNTTLYTVFNRCLLFRWCEFIRIVFCDRIYALFQYYLSSCADFWLLPICFIFLFSFIFTSSNSFIMIFVFAYCCILWMKMFLKILFSLLVHVLNENVFRYFSFSILDKSFKRIFLIVVSK